MKKQNRIVAIVLTFLMVFTTFSSIAETTQETMTPFSIDMTFSVNKDAVKNLIAPDVQDEQTEKTIQAIAELINNIDLETLTDGVDTEIILNYKDTNLINAALLKDDNYIQLHSNLFPNYSLKIETEQQFDAFDKIELDPEKLLDPLMKAYDELQSKISDPESVNKSFFEKEFTSKKKINMTTKELLMLYFGAIKEFLDNDQIKDILHKMENSGLTVSITDIEKAVEEIKNTNDEELPETEIYIYENEDQDLVFDGSAKKDDQNAYFTIGKIEDSIAAECNIEDKAKIYFIGAKDNESNLFIELKQSQESIINIEAHISKKEDNAKYASIIVKLNGSELAVINIKINNENSLKGIVDTQNKKEININELSNQASETAQEFFMDLQKGGMQVLSTLMQAFPELATIMQTAN